MVVNTTGITTSSDDVRLVTVNGNLNLAADIDLVNGDLTLDVNGSVTQDAGATIEANGLRVLGSPRKCRASRAAP